MKSVYCCGRGSKKFVKAETADNSILQGENESNHTNKFPIERLINTEVM